MTASIVMDLSLIIPAYNVEAYIGPCLDSIYDGNPNLSSFEVIVVNDGSTDGTAAVIDRYARQYGNLMVISQENQGLSMARTNGLAKAQGDYVWFVDSDDYLPANGLRDALTLIRESSPGTLFLMPLRWVGGEDGSVSFDYEIDRPLSMTGRDVLFDPRFPQWMVGRYLIPRSLFDNKSLFFPKGLIHEDEYFGSVLLMLADQVLVCDKSLFNHRIRPGSIMQTLSIQSSYDCVSNYELLKAFSKTLPCPEQKSFVRHAQRLLHLSYITNEKNWNTPGFRRFKREKGPYILSELLRNARSYTFRELVPFLLLVIAPNTFRRLYPAN